MSGNRGNSKFFVKCWNCTRHFIGESLLDRFDNKCDICDANLDRTEDRV